jgi:cell division protein ZapB
VSSWDEEIARLETHVTELLARLDRLTIENEALRARLEELGEERARLIGRGDEARRRVESLIARLRTLEEGA